MKILTIAGTRPELIRLSVIIKKLDERMNHVLLWTGQNFAENLSDLFFRELDIRNPDIILTTDSIGEWMVGMEKALKDHKPDKVLVLGDTFSGLLSVIASRYNVPVYHMEAGNRCLDEKVPEERNRRIIDSLAAINMPYTQNSYDNLIREGYSKNKTFKIGNPIGEVLNHYSEQIENSDILGRLGLMPHEWLGIKDPPVKYVLATFHRAENTDNDFRLFNILHAIEEISIQMPVIVSMHPRTKSKIPKSFSFGPNVKELPAFGFFDFVKLEENAFCTLTDSGTVPEESAIFGTPCIAMRDTTERQELLEAGCMILTGTKTKNIVHAFEQIKKTTHQAWLPNDYIINDTSERVIKILCQ